MHVPFVLSNLFDLVFVKDLSLRYVAASMKFASMAGWENGTNSGQ